MFTNRSLSQLPKSFSHNSLDRGAAKLGRAVRQQAASSAAMLIRLVSSFIKTGKIQLLTGLG